MSIWDFNKRLTRRLLAWAVASVGLGARFLQQKDGYSQGLGTQFVGWGAVDGLIALVGGLLAGRRRSQPDGDTPEQRSAEARNLSRILAINTLLDVGYVLGGWWLARTKGAADRTWRGHGRGIMVQGGFLFLFDLVHWLLVPRGEGDAISAEGEPSS